MLVCFASRSHQSESQSKESIYIAISEIRTIHILHECRGCLDEREQLVQHSFRIPKGHRTVPFQHRCVPMTRVGLPLRMPADG